MKHIFDWLREQIEENSAVEFVNDGACFNYIPKILAENIINEAEAKWESDCCEWKQYETKYGTRYQNCRATEQPIDIFGFKFCPYCGKPIKNSEVE